MRYLFFFLLLTMFFSCNNTITEEHILPFDLFIRNGQVYDSNKNTFVKTNIGIVADTIYFIGDSSPQPVKRIIEAEGYLVAPGFIDTHTHALSDLSHAKRKANLNYLHQGVTTVFVGSDGGGPINTEELLTKWEAQGIGTNAALMAGHRSIRRLVMGMDNRPPTPEELDNMKTLVKRSMEAGAFGLSTGLYYAPNSFASTEEVIELAKVAAAYGGIYDSHIRDESSYNIGLTNAIRELIQISKEAGLPGNISHIKALGVDVWDKSEEIVAIVDSARDAGLDITADQYPYQASGTSLTGALISKWVLADADDYRTKFDDPNMRKRIVEDMTENLRRRGGSASILLTFPKQEELKGKTLEVVAKEWNMPPIEAAIKIIKEGDSSIASFNMKEKDIRYFMKQPWVMTCSDGSAGHPRKFGSYPQKIKEYVLEKAVIDMPTMIYKSSVLPAQTFQVHKRGDLQKGYYADIIIFKPEEVNPRANFESPAELAEGMHYVIVNGKVVLENGEFTDTLSGNALRLQIQ